MEEGHFCEPQLGPVSGAEECGYHLRHLAAILGDAKEAGYTFQTCAEVASGEIATEPVMVLRHDLDALPFRAHGVAMLEHRLGIRASYFVRVHANEYNAFGFDTVRLLRELVAMGHEVGLHAEPLDLRAATGCDPDRVIPGAIRMLEAMTGGTVHGMASHNDVTPDNNLDYVTPTKIRSLGLRYEAYDRETLGLFHNATYVTDGHYWRWRAYVKGRRTADERCLCRHVEERSPRLYVLLHPHVWHERHFHLVTTGAMPAVSELDETTGSGRHIGY